jgi:phage anti-repressor protein
MPYNYRIIKIIENKNLTLDCAKEICILERKLKNKNKSNEYIPLQNIRGKFECFNKINIEING